MQSVLAPAGAPAASIYSLWQVMLWTTGAVFVVVMAFLLVALVRNRAHAQTSEQTLTRTVTAAVTLTVGVLIGLLVVSVTTGRAVAAHATDAVTIDVNGHQWWWEVEYEHATPSERFVTANEIHIPVGRPVVLKVQSRDVIHSFWAPNLQGKRDLIPGYTTAIWIQADREGAFRGQCAEFCGKQHAHMAFDIVAQTEAEFEEWRAHMRGQAPAPATEEEQKGRDLFMRDRCSGCHTIRGTDAGGLNGPDLTHIASRQTIAAGTLPNTPSHLSDWIRDSQSIKPYNQMPPTSYSRDDLDALVAYLGSLR